MVGAVPCGRRGVKKAIRIPVSGTSQCCGGIPNSSVASHNISNTVKVIDRSINESRPVRTTRPPVGEATL